jgi:alpha-mannosidase
MSHSMRTRACLALLTGLIAAATASAQSTAKPKPTVREVIVVYKTHFDIGYTDMAREVVQKYRTTMIDNALAVVDRNRDLPPERQFVWTVAAWPMTKILEDWPGQTPARKAAVLAAFKEGRFAAQAMPFTVQTELEDPETLVRGLGFATRLTRDAGLPLPRGAKMTDVPAHSWLLPTLLTHAGVTMLHIGCNAASTSPRVPLLFWWEGPDGSRLLTFYSAAGYGTGLEPPPDWPHKTWLAMIMSGDNAGPPTPESVKQLLDQAAKSLPGVTVRIGQLSDFADRILAEKPDLPVIRGDMPDTWIHGPQCDPAGVALARTAAPAAAAAESLGTLLKTWGVSSPDPSAAIARSHEQALLYFEHTWGGALGWVTKYGNPKGTGLADHWVYGDAWKAERQAGRFQRLEASWDEHSTYARVASETIQPVLAGELKALAEATGVAGRRVVVYNPLPWARDGIVTAPDPGGRCKTLEPVGGGKPVRVESDGGHLRFLARDVPPLGYRVYTPVAGEPGKANRFDEGPPTIANDRLWVDLDRAHGAIRSIKDRRTGRELVDLASPYRFGQYVYERFDADQVAAYVKAYVKADTSWAFAELGKPNMPPASEVARRTVTPTAGRISFENNALSISALLESSIGGAPGHDVRTRVTLYQDAPYVDLEVTITKPADPWPEAGWLALPFKAEAPRFRVGRGGSVIDPAKDIVPGGNRHMLAADTGVAVLDANGRGGAVCSPDAPLVSLGEPGCWKFSWDYVPKIGSVYINLFNNQWTTNYRLWNEGRWTYHVRVWAVDGEGDGPGLVTPALEARHPLLATAADGPAGALPAVNKGLELSRKGVLVTAFGADPEGRPGTLLRIWERAGEAGTIAVRLPAAMKVAKATPVNLRGEPAGAVIPIVGGSFSFNLGAFSPASFVLE